VSPRPSCRPSTLDTRWVIARDAICSSSDESHDALLTLYKKRFSVQVAGCRGRGNP
jgi:hypothetical protein